MTKKYALMSSIALLACPMFFADTQSSAGQPETGLQELMRTKFQSAYDGASKDGGYADLARQARERSGISLDKWNNEMDDAARDAAMQGEYTLRYITKLDAPVIDTTPMSIPPATEADREANDPDPDGRLAEAKAADEVEEGIRRGGIGLDPQFSGKSDAMTNPPVSASEAEARRRVSEKLLQPGDANPGGPTFARDARMPGVALGNQEQALQSAKQAEGTAALSQDRINELRARGELPDDPARTEDMSVEDRLGRIERMMGIPGPPAPASEPLTDRAN